MPALQNDPDIREALFSLEEKLTIQQVRFVAERLRDLLTRYRTASRDQRAKPIEWAEWSAFIDAAYSCGFVCRDGGEDMGDREKKRRCRSSCDGSRAISELSIHSACVTCAGSSITS